MAKRKKGSLHIWDNPCCEDERCQCRSCTEYMPKSGRCFTGNFMECAITGKPTRGCHRYKKRKPKPPEQEITKPTTPIESDNTLGEKIATYLQDLFEREKTE